MVYEFPMFQSHAEHLADAKHALGTRALAARRTGAAPPLFALPTGTGDLTYAFNLSAHLSADVPVYALPWPEVMPATMDALAAHMVDLMRPVRAHGPYRLLGYASGGLLAYAVAQRLCELDEPVDFIGLLDCDNSAIPPLLQTQEERAKENFVGQLRQLVQDKSHDDDICAAVQQLHDCARSTSWAELVARCEAFPALCALAAKEQSSISQFAASCVRMTTYEAMWPTYLAQPLPAPLKLHLFYATEEADPPQPMGWDQLLPSERIAVVPVPGTHRAVIEPAHVQELGRAVSQALGEARAGDIPAHAPALVLQGGGQGVPIVCVPGAGDSITGFMQLGMALGTEQALIGMQPRGVDGCHLPYGSVELAAAAYLAAMRSHVPRGAPVHLLGHSFGGWVVFEMARQLRAEGVKVTSLTLVDTGAPDDLPGVRDHTRNAVVHRFLEALALRIPTPLPIDASRLHALNPQALIEALHRIMVDLGLMPPRSSPDALRGPFYSFARACRTRYCPGTPYEGPVNLVLVRDTRLDAEADARQREHIEQQWRAHAPALQVWHGPGNHMTVLRPPNVAALVEGWRAMLRGSTAPLTPLIQ